MVWMIGDNVLAAAVHNVGEEAICQNFKEVLEYYDIDFILTLEGTGTTGALYFWLAKELQTKSRVPPEIIVLHAGDRLLEGVFDQKKAWVEFHEFLEHIIFIVKKCNLELSKEKRVWPDWYWSEICQCSRYNRLDYPELGKYLRKNLNSTLAGLCKHLNIQVWKNGEIGFVCTDLFDPVEGSLSQAGTVKFLSNLARYMEHLINPRMAQHHQEVAHRIAEWEDQGVPNSGAFWVEDPVEQAWDRLDSVEYDSLVEESKDKVARALRDSASMEKVVKADRLETRIRFDDDLDESDNEANVSQETIEEGEIVEGADSPVIASFSAGEGDGLSEDIRSQVPSEDSLDAVYKSVDPLRELSSTMLFDDELDSQGN